MAGKEYIPPYEEAESEFETDPHYYVVFATNGLTLGRMIGASKSTYCKEHEGDLIIFNANVIAPSVGKIWYGDLNVTLAFDDLKNIADQIGEDLYILMEGDARFGYEKQPIETLMAKARTVIKCNKKLKQKKEKKIFPKLSSSKTKNNGANN
jgi:hypothetical protein